MLTRSKSALSRNYRSPGLPYKIHHPHVVDAQWDEALPNREAVTEGLAKYIPRNFAHQQFVESIRTGEFLGPDYPYAYLPPAYWAKRRYNVNYQELPVSTSKFARVDFYPRLNVWNVAWTEASNGKTYNRWFRVQPNGFLGAKLKAEKFQAMLASSGRIKAVSEEKHESKSKEDYLQKRASRAAQAERTRLIRRGLF